MEEPNKKIYTPAHIGFGTFLGSWLLGAYMMGHNYRVFGQLRRAWMVWIFGILLTAILIGLCVCIETEASTSILPTLIAVGAYHLTQRLQGASIEKHLTEGGLAYKWWYVILLTLSIVALILILLMWALLSVVPL